MVTEIFYKYRDGLHVDVKQGQITLDKGLYKKYTDSYNTNHDDNIKNLNRRLWNCHLVTDGNFECKAFLNDIADFWNNSGEGFSESYEESEFKKLHEFLLKREMVEIIFTLC